MPEIARPSVRIVAFCDDRDGEIYFLDHEGGTIHTIERNDAGAGNVAFPTRLSQTGLFATVKDQAPMPGVLPFAVNCRQWQDGATAEHWVAFPGESSATLYTEAKPIPGMVDWHSFRMQFPKDAVLVRSISLAGRRLETQLLHYDGVDWYAYTYAWRDDQADADLVPADGAEKEVHDGERKRVWSFHSRSQCMSCHSTWSEFALAFRPEQLNRPGPDGRNQLVVLTEAGLIRRAEKDGKHAPAVRRRLGRPGASARRPGRRQRSPWKRGPGLTSIPTAGTAMSMAGVGRSICGSSISVTNDEMKAIGVRPSRGDFALPDAAIIKPGDPWASTLYFRMAKFGRDRMPHLGSERPDETGLDVIARWIAGMGPGAKSPERDPDSGPPGPLLARPKSALRLARRLARGELDPAERAALLGRRRPAPERPDPRPVRGLSAIGRAERAETRLEPAAQGHPRPRR